MKPSSIVLMIFAPILWACAPGATISGVSLTSVPAATGGQLNIVQNQSVTITATVVGTGAFDPTIQWSLNPDDGSLLTKGAKATFTPKSGGTYTLAAIAQADTSKRASLIATVTVPDVLVIATPTSINPNQPSNLTATVKDIGGAVSWSVDPTAGTSFSPSTPGNATSFTSSQTGTYTVTATSLTDPNRKGTVTVQVSSVTGVTVSATPNVLGINQTSSLSASVQGQNSPSGDITWSVLPTAGSSLTPNGSSASFSASTPGAFTVTATSLQDPTKSSSAVILVPWTGSRLIGTGASDTIRGSATDTDGNVYIAGFTTGALQGSNQGQFDAFVAKYDASGAQLWVRQLGSSKDDLAYGVAVDVSGNVYVAGTTSGILPSASSAGNDDAFVAKYDASGTQLWVSQFGTSGFENAFGVAVGADGSVFVAGDTDGSFSGATNPDPGNTDAFVARINPANGARLWTRQIGVTGNDTAYGIAVDANGNVDIGGSTEGALSGNSSGLRDAFVAQYNSSGAQVWVRQFGSSGSDEIRGVAVDASGNVLVAGQTDGTLPGSSSAGLGDAFVAKYSASGTQTWLSQFGSSLDDAANGIAVDSSGNAYVSGQTDGNLPGNSSAGGTDAFLTKFDGSGARQWIKQVGTASTDVGFAVSVADRGSSAVLVGYTEGTPFDGLTSAGGREGFITKYKPDGSR